MIKPANNIKWIVRLIPALLLLLVTLAAQAEGAAIAVLYPDVRAPYDRIFNDILKGIEQQSGKKIVTYAIKKDDSLERVNDWLEQTNPATLIALGSRGKAVAGKLGADATVVVGASILSDKNIAQGMLGISLTPSPLKLFAKLQELAPEVKTVHVIYHPDTNAWLIELAKKSAAARNLTIVATPASDVREAAIHYKTTLKENARGEHAIWLLQGDPTLDERSLLPTILSKAWNKNYVVFSSNPSHVKRGALFSLFPDNIKMGASLAQKAQRIMKGKDQDVDPLEDLLIAVNVRTAEHLSLGISRAQARDFNLVFPAK